MVRIEPKGDEFVLHVLGSHRFWAFKSELRIKPEQIVAVTSVDLNLRPPWCRCPGTCVPWVICAGTYYGRGRKEFWDRTPGAQGIQIELKGGSFTRVVVDVADAEEAKGVLGF